MNTVAKLQAAMKRLEELRDASTGDHWIVAAEDGESNVCPDGEGVILWGEYGDSRDTELVVVLHRTIDAQLTLLSSAIGDYDPGSDVQVPLVAYSEDLADAILKESQP